MTTALAFRRRLAGLVSTADRRILAAGASVAVGSALSQIVGVLKELFVAKTFGAGDAIDAFLIAMVLPTFAINVVAGAFSAAVIPTFVQVRDRRGRAAAQELFSNVVGWSIILLVLVSILIGLAFPALLPLLAASFSAPKRLLTERIMYVVLPVLAFNGVALIWSSVLNAEGRYFESAIAPIAVPAATVAGLFIFGPTIGVYGLAIGTVAGYAIRAGYIAGVLRQTGYRLRVKFAGGSAETRIILRQYLPMIAGGALMSGTALIDQAMAAMLPSGSVATLGYAQKVPAAVFTIVALAVGTVALPHFSTMAAAEQWDEIRIVLARYSRIAALWTTVATVVLIVASRPLVRVLFERGAFGAADTIRVARVQAILLAQLPFYVLGTIYVRLISALRHNSVLWWGTVISFPLNIAGNYLLMRFYDVDGIAMSTVIVYIVSAAYLWLGIRRVLRGFPESPKSERGEGPSPVT